VQAACAPLLAGCQQSILCAQAAAQSRGAPRGPRRGCRFRAEGVLRGLGRSSVGAELSRLFGGGTLCSIAVFLVPWSKRQGGRGCFLLALRSLVACPAEGGGAGRPGGLGGGDCHAHWVSLPAQLSAPLAPQKTQLIPPSSFLKDLFRTGGCLARGGVSRRLAVGAVLCPHALDACIAEGCSLPDSGPFGPFVRCSLPSPCRACRRSGERGLCPHPGGAREREGGSETASVRPLSAAAMGGMLEGSRRAYLCARSREAASPRPLLAQEKCVPQLPRSEPAGSPAPRPAAPASLRSYF